MLGVHTAVTTEGAPLLGHEDMLNGECLAWRSTQPAIHTHNHITKGAVDASVSGCNVSGARCLGCIECLHFIVCIVVEGRGFRKLWVIVVMAEGMPIRPVRSMLWLTIPARMSSVDE